METLFYWFVFFPVVALSIKWWLGVIRKAVKNHRDIAASIERVSSALREG